MKHIKKLSTFHSLMIEQQNQNQASEPRSVNEFLPFSWSEPKGSEKTATFDLDHLHDLSSYKNRYLTQLNKSNGYMFFVSDRRIQEAKDALDRYRKLGKLNQEDFSMEEMRVLRSHQRIVGATVHPETREIIPRCMRLSGLSVMNIPHVYCMLFVQQSPLFSCANICYNQSLQAMVNYGNGNQRSPETTREALRGVASAVAVSSSVVLGTRMAFSKRI